MKQRYLEVSYQHGKPLAAYLYLPRREGDRSARTERLEAGLLVDYAPDGRAIGVEISAPGRLTLAALNGVLAKVQQTPATPEELAPLLPAEAVP
jgi:uncharacterized protein YuzE